MISREDGKEVGKYEEKRMSWNNDGLGDDVPRKFMTLPEVRN